ncbi:MAG: hypothetical protein OXC10_07640 [Rhodospirillaceae bacterium]|nr:hypothetical protein [Rhodospirillaceae bacterium]
MQTHDALLIEALAAHIVLARELMVGDIETVAEAHGMTPAEAQQATGWFRAIAEPAYRGTAVLAAASARATRLRHGPPLRPAWDGPDPTGADAEFSRAETKDRPDLSRPERPCARCRRRFQPTLRRRMLCGYCFRGDEEQDAGRPGLSLLRAATP